MTAPDLVNLSALIDDAKCFALVRQHRWPEGVRCPACGGASVVRDGCDDRQAHRQRYRCKACAGRFDDLTGTVLAGHHQPLRMWVLCLYFMGLNLSNRQIARELGLDGSDVQAMTEALRGGLAAKAPPARLAGEVEIDEVYVVAGHKGQPAAVAKGGGLDAAAGWRARRAAARWRRTGRPSSAWSSAAGRWCCACWPTCGRRRSDRSSRPPSPRAPASTPTSMPATPACRPGATGT
jgi:transposase-like protein